MKKTTIIKGMAIGIFTLLMAFNITMTIQDNDSGEVDLSLSGVQSMAFGYGENGGAGLWQNSAIGRGGLNGSASNPGYSGRGGGGSYGGNGGSSYGGNSIGNPCNYVVERSNGDLWTGQLNDCQPVTKTTDNSRFSGGVSLGYQGSGGNINYNDEAITSRTFIKCAYSTYDPYNVGYDREIRTYNTMKKPVKRC